jgi:hypothetical protein
LLFEHGDWNGVNGFDWMLWWRFCMLVMLLLLCGDDNGVWEDYDSGGFGRDDCVVLVRYGVLCMLMKVWFNGEDEYDFFLCFGCE